MKILKISITGNSGLAQSCMKIIDAEWHPVRSTGGQIPDIAYDCDVFINNAHVNQLWVLNNIFTKWKNLEHKHIINISSRASQPNISVGYKYAAEKAAINHYANNVTYNSDKRCKITTINLGLLNSQLPSLPYDQVAEYIDWILAQPKHIDISEMTIQHRANYTEVQQAKCQRMI